VFFDQLAHEAGYRFAWERLDPKQNVVACKAAYNDDERPLQLLLGSLLESL
jgi:fido (protein-threonine AMPylation protein)